MWRKYLKEWLPEECRSCGKQKTCCLSNKKAFDLRDRLKDSLSKWWNSEHLLEWNNNALLFVFDIETAFETVWTEEGLLYKIHNLLGDVLEQSTITWFSSDLTERKGVVCIDKTQSESVTFESGVPQGGALSPLLYIVFVNDLVNQLKNSTTRFLFADDTALLIEIDKDLRIDQVQNQAQEDLNKINTWFRFWRIRLSAEKTKFRILSKQKNSQANNFRRHLTFRVGDHEAVEDNDPATRDLGIWLDDHLTYNEHIQKVVSVGTERINLLKTLANKNLGVGRETLLNTYIMWLRPVLEYGSVLFGMAHIKLLHQIENVQTETLEIALGTRKPISRAAVEVEAHSSTVSSTLWTCG